MNGSIQLVISRFLWIDLYLANNNNEGKPLKNRCAKVIVRTDEGERLLHPLDRRGPGVDYLDARANCLFPYVLPRLLMAWSFERSDYNCHGFVAYVRNPSWDSPVWLPGHQVETGETIGRCAKSFRFRDLIKGGAFAIFADNDEPIHSFLVFPPQMIFGKESLIVVHKPGRIGLQVTTLKEVDILYKGSSVRRMVDS